MNPQIARTLLFGALSITKPKLLALGAGTSMAIYRHNADKLIKLANPVDLPAGTVTGITFNNKGSFLALSMDASPYVTVYVRNNFKFNKLDSVSFGLSSASDCLAFSKDNSFMAVGTQSTPFIHMYSIVNNAFTKLSDPSDLPTGRVRSVRFSSDGVYLACTCHGTPSSSPSIVVYKRTGTSFVKLPFSLPLADMPQGFGLACSWSSDNKYLVVTHVDFPYMSIYKFNEFFPVKLANPASLAQSSAECVSFSPDNTYLAIGQSIYLKIYKRLGDTFTLLTGIPTFSFSTTALVRSLCWSADGAYLAIGVTDSPFVYVYKRNIDTFTLLPSPLVLPSGASSAISFYPVY